MELEEQALVEVEGANTMPVKATCPLFLQWARGGAAMELPRGLLWMTEPAATAVIEAPIAYKPCSSTSFVGREQERAALLELLLQEEVLLSYLQDRDLLLVLDNLEHLLAAAPLITNLLATSRRLCILITSRAVD